MIIFLLLLLWGVIGAIVAVSVADKIGYLGEVPTQKLTLVIFCCGPFAWLAALIVMAGEGTELLAKWLEKPLAKEVKKK